MVGSPVFIFEGWLQPGIRRPRVAQQQFRTFFRFDGMKKFQRLQYVVFFGRLYMEGFFSLPCMGSELVNVNSSVLMTDYCSDYALPMIFCPSEVGFCR
jgi:hypothetical protein